MALDLLRLAHHARSNGGPMTIGQWLLVGAIVEPGRGSVHSVLLSHGNATELPVKRGIPVSERSGLSQHRNDGSALATMRMT